jgi:hypothetical protein
MPHSLKNGIVELNVFLSVLRLRIGTVDGAQKNQVLIAISKNKQGHLLHVKMKVISDMKESTVMDMDFSQQFIEKSSQIKSDAH